MMDTMRTLQRLSLRSAAEIRTLKHIITEFWLVSINCWAFQQALKAGRV